MPFTCKLPSQPAPATKAFVALPSLQHWWNAVNPTSPMRPSPSLWGNEEAEGCDPCRRLPTNVLVVTFRGCGIGSRDVGRPPHPTSATSNHDLEPPIVCIVIADSYLAHSAFLGDARYCHVLHVASEKRMQRTCTAAKASGEEAVQVSCQVRVSATPPLLPTP